MQPNTCVASHGPHPPPGKDPYQMCRPCDQSAESTEMELRHRKITQAGNSDSSFRLQAPSVFLNPYRDGPILIPPYLSAGNKIEPAIPSSLPIHTTLGIQSWRITPDLLVSRPSYTSAEYTCVQGLIIYHSPHQVSPSLLIAAEYGRSNNRQDA